LALTMRTRNVTEDIHGTYSFAVPWLLGIADSEDQDMDNIRTAGLQTWLQSGRILKCGVLNYWYVQADSGVVGGLTHDGFIIGMPTLDIDWKGGVKMKPDDIVWLVMQSDFDQAPGNADYVDNDVQMGIVGYSRVLISK